MEEWAFLGPACRPEPMLARCKTEVRGGWTRRIVHNMPTLGICSSHRASTRLCPLASPPVYTLPSLSSVPLAVFLFLTSVRLSLRFLPTRLSCCISVPRPRLPSS
jgi:hypothetical protein